VQRFASSLIQFSFIKVHQLPFILSPFQVQLDVRNSFDFSFSQLILAYGELN